MKKNAKRLVAMMMALLMAAVAPAAFAEDIGTPTDLQPVVTAEPTAVPTVVPTAEPTAVPTAEPTPVPTAEPTVKPTAEPTAVPTPEPTAVPLPDPYVTLTSNLEGMETIAAGTEMVLTIQMHNAAGRAYTIQWQQSTDMGQTWQDIEGATSEQFRLVLGVEHSNMLWRANISMEETPSV